MDSQRAIALHNPRAKHILNIVYIFHRMCIFIRSINHDLPTIQKKSGLFRHKGSPFKHIAHNSFSTSEFDPELVFR